MPMTSGKMAKSMKTSHDTSQGAFAPHEPWEGYMWCVSKKEALETNTPL
jgi:hypothetical protein